MRYVIIRDDDTNALTPIDCLERLYRPFLDRGLPVNLAVIPDVATNAVTPDGDLEGFLLAGDGAANGAPVDESSKAPVPSPSRFHANAAAAKQTLSIGSNPRLVQYLLENPGYQIVQHGCHHDCFEFDRASAVDLSRRLEEGTRLLLEAGFPRPDTFVAPHDKLSRAGLQQVAERFRVLSTGWFELGRLPVSWWPNYFAKKIRRAPHWRVGQMVLLSHPGCLLSCRRDYNSMLAEIIRSIHSRRVTVLVTHWWEYFRDHRPDDRFIPLLHQVADRLASSADIRVISFSDLAQGMLPLN